MTRSNKRMAMLLCAALASVVWLAARQAPVTPIMASRLTLKIVDKASGKPVPARILVRTSDGTDHLPEGAMEVKIGRDRWFVTSGSVELPVPSGALLLRVERGKEYRPIKQQLTIPVAGSMARTIRLEHWIDMRKQGYLSGEDHLHLPPEQLVQALAAEDLDFGTSLQWWNGPKWEADMQPGVRTLSWHSWKFPCSVFDAEVETPWGWAYMLGLEKPLTLAPAKERSDFPYLEEARRQRSLICYHSGWGREVLPDALLGLVDVVNVCNNLFHRHKFSPRPQYSNQLEIPGFKTYGGTAEEMMMLNIDAYYRLLNCGLQLPAGAGSAAGVKSNPAGYSRSYVHVNGKKSIEEFRELWRQGRNFVTNGPMLFLTAEGQHEPGDTLQLPAEGGTMRLKVRAISDQPLRSLELIANGDVVSRAALEPNTRSAQLSFILKVAQGTWLAARATDEDQLLSEEELKGYSRPGNIRELPTRLRFAHTSPIYVTVAGKGARVTRSLNEGQQILDAFDRFARKQSTAQHLAEAEHYIERARAKLQELKAQ